MKLFFFLTTYYPRKLPTNEGQWDKMREVLHTYYGVPDDLQVWATILGFIGSVPASTIRRSYGYFANVGKRTLINKAIKEEQRKTIEAYQELLKATTEATVKHLEKDEALVANTEAADGANVLTTTPVMGNA